ncbi:hydrolase [Aureisphaera galaxeae]|uniref:hydrolase n=1 Tax=Aureisphaera galaxeae TaxID=1538023 RepID=UPI002350F20E|nr:hydrolase [Aureisphaera galaxeae]MDC8003968.1 hydrolase [Aureisphaera galaxeae]
MKSKIFMYLFFFSILLVLFMYMNQKSIYESQEKKITSLNSSLEKKTDSIAKMAEILEDADYFKLQGNDNAMTYLENLGLEPAAVENEIRELILEKNLEKGGNPLVDYEGYGEFRINHMKFLNHRWIQAEFSDGSTWGEMIVEYFYDHNMQLELTPVSSILYPN